jgi:glucose-6-phosphate 1-dehydrogenase
MAATTQVNRDSDVEVHGKAAGPCIFVLFGAAGDLTKRKLVPALFNLVRAKLLPENFAVMGVSVDDLGVEDFRNQVTGFLPTGDDGRDSLEWFRQRLFYERGDFGDANTFVKLRERLNSVDLERHTEGNYLFYLATAPRFFAPIVEQLGKAGLATQANGHWRRIVIEKPFGHDLDSAKV